MGGQPKEQLMPITIHLDAYYTDVALCGAVAALGEPLALSSDADTVTCEACAKLDCCCDRITTFPCPIHDADAD
jgi:hypothetical protein